jgi:hypothetical protein
MCRSRVVGELGPELLRYESAWGTLHLAFGIVIGSGYGCLHLDRGVAWCTGPGNLGTHE